MSRFENYRNIYGQDRTERAMVIFRNGKIIHLGNNKYIVPSQTSAGQTYRVYYPFKCTCPDYGTTRKACKHILAAGMFIQNYRLRNPISSKRSSKIRSWRKTKVIRRNL
jgi:hypothetical protein